MKKTSGVFSVSVGNIAFGGRGKTPTVAHIARLLKEIGERPAIVSRGYGRRWVEDGVVVVSDGRRLLADLDRSGDEPLMLARQLPGVPVLVSEQRAVGAALARHILGATAIVLDDGFQHRQMSRDVDLVLVTEGDLSGRRVPFGRLREPPSALSRADAVIGDGFSPNVSTCSFSGSLVRQSGSPVPVSQGGPPLPAGSRVFLLAGIAGPERFTGTATEAGYVVAGTWAPGDHHRYTRADVARVAREVEAAGASAVLTTSKDVVRLMPLRPLPFDVYEWPLQVTIEPADQFLAWLIARRDLARADPSVEAASA